MLKKSLLLITTAMLIVPSTAAFADKEKKEDRRERARQEAPSRPQANKPQRAPRNDARPKRVDRRDMAAPSGNYRKTGSRAEADRGAAQRGRGEDRARPVRKREVTHTSPSPVRNQPVRVNRDERRQPTREVRNPNRGREGSTSSRPRSQTTIDRRDVTGGGTFNMDYKRRTTSVPATNNNRGGRNVSYDDNRRRGDNDHRGRGNDHRGRDGDHRGRGNDHRGRDHDRNRDHRYDHRDRRDHRGYRDRHRNNTRIYIGFGTYPYSYGYYGRRNYYYGHYGYGDWPFYSGYWHARSHWAWYNLHSHYHYGGYCPGHSYRTTYYYDEPVYQTSTSYSSNAGNEIAGTILGGVIGGILGSEIDGGRNRTAGIVVGSLLGASVGNSIARSNSRTVSSYRYTPDDDYYYDDPDAYRYESETYSPPSGAEVRKCIEYDVRGGNYVCRRWIVEYEN